ncbi:hypothetical protein MANES_15G180633v8 [Manihot esculenta]|uniref:Uncharacterized protein n=1 Tax=Manihot esculenta TaxID=3983 RepID=A0ACB7GCK1_MANES|nr:hypothetical protein MANES_15G180633v8 [Manihot esculenta]
MHKKTLNFLPSFQRQTPTEIIMSSPSSSHLLHRHHYTRTFPSLTNSITHKPSSLIPPRKTSRRKRRRKKKEISEETAAILPFLGF